MKYYLLYIFLCAGFLLNSLFGSTYGLVTPANVDPIVIKADSLYKAGNYYEASLLFGKASFFSEDQTLKAKFLFKKSNALKQLMDFEGAEKALAPVDYSALSDTLHFTIRHEAAFCAYLYGNFKQAESHLIQLNYFIRDSSITMNSYPLYSLVLNELEKWNDAKNLLQTYLIKSPLLSDTARNRMVSQVNELYNEKNIPRLKKVNKAVILSRVIPGLGQIYAGYWGEGIASFLFNATALGLTAVGVYYHYFITSFAIGFTVFEKFYVGNTKRAEFLAKKTNYKRKKKFNEEAKDLIIPIFK